MRLNEISGPASVSDMQRRFEGKQGVYFLVLALPDCDACEHMKSALAGFEDNDFVFDSAVWSPPTNPEVIEELASVLGITEFPSLLMLVDGKMFKRWSGFFASDSAAERQALLAQVLSQSLRQARTENGPPA